MLSLVYTTLFFALGFAVSDATIKDCGNGLSILQLTDLALKPDPPVGGQLLDMTVKFINPDSDIINGTVTTSLTLNFIPFTPTVEPLCVNTKCPLVNGLNDRSTSNTFPDNVSGKLVSKITWTDLDGSLLLCIQISTQLASKNSTNLRGTKSTTAIDLNALQTVFRKKHSSIPILQKNMTKYTSNVKHHNLNTFYLYEDVYNTSSNNICLPNEEPKSLIVWKPKLNALR
jgi:hypothetical protein